MHVWNEPKPVWRQHKGDIPLHMELAIQSYLVLPGELKSLIEKLNLPAFVNESQLWLEEPEYQESLATLRLFPNNHGNLRTRCNLSSNWMIKDWNTNACWTTCRCAPDGTKGRTRAGSMPLPQLADIGRLVWLGESFNFGYQGDAQPLVRNFGTDFWGLAW